MTQAASAASSSSSSGKGRGRRHSLATTTLMLLVMATVLCLPMWMHGYWTGGGGGGGAESGGTTGRAAGITMEFFSAGMAALPSRTGARGGSSSSSSRQRRRRVGDGRNDNNDDDGNESLRRRVNYLETKLNAYLAFSSDPFLSTKTPAKCSNMTSIKDLGCSRKNSKGRCELDGQMVCLDDFPAAGTGEKGGNGGTGQQQQQPLCLVYDFGIRESPEYGLAFAGPPFHCDVVGLDPSPISIKWWEKKGDAIRKEYPTYKFVPVGAGGHDGMTTLGEYDWGQVSIITFPERTVNTSSCNKDGLCKYAFHPLQATHKIPVKTLSTLVKDLGHSGNNRRITMLKLDVEGSEYALLEHLIEHDVDLCRRIDQLTLEWHHYDYDKRYGVRSNPQINLLVKLLEKRCGLEQFWVHGSGGWPSNVKVYTEMGMTLYYNLASFKRTRWSWNDEEVTAKRE